MKISLLILLGLIVWPVAGFAQSEAYYRVGFYNLENLFHPSNDSLKRDDEFTPEGQRFWSFYKYREKTNRMAKAILSIGEYQPIDLLGLAEVENRLVLDDLIENPVLKKANYRVVHYESPDRRGIDVAALYRPERLTLINSKAFPLKLDYDPGFRSRDVLYLQMSLDEFQDTLHIFYCHWPSRYGGQAQSEPKRRAAATLVRSLVDSLQKAYADPQIVIAGDFNDEWFNQSLSNDLRALDPKDFDGETSELYNLMRSLDANTGSHRYHGEWTYLDQIIVTGKLFTNSQLQITNRQAHVVHHAFLMEEDEKYPGEKPFRTFIGFRFNGGFSDHLPVYINIVKDDKTQPQP